MKNYRSRDIRFFLSKLFSNRLTLILCCALWLADSGNSVAEDSKSIDADKAWKAFEKASQPAPPPAEWQNRSPSPEEITKFQGGQAKKAGDAADQAKEFYTRFPNHPKANEGRKREFELMSIAVQLGETNRLSRLEQIETERLKDPNLAPDERFQIRADAVQRSVMARQPEGPGPMLIELESGARKLLKEFPDRPEVYGMLLEVAGQSEAENGRKLAQEIIESNAADPVKEMAKGLVKKMEALGKPLAVKLTALDGRGIDLTKMPGKVVLVDFWATWCGPCVAELPKVKAAYEKFHSRGFEIVGISFDREREKLENFVAKEKIPWPQYLDEESKLGQEYAIQTIPTMWLVDKKGNLRDLNATVDLEGRVEKLLAEKE